MADGLHLEPKHRRILEALLREHLPDVEVWAYGSRVTGRSHDGSDLDLVLRGPDLEEIPTGQLGDFEEAVRESSIPFLVEARDWARLPDRFHKEVEREYLIWITREDNAPADLGWPVTTVAEISEKVAIGPFGSSIKVETFVPSGIPVISGQHLHGSRLDDSPGFNFITEEHAQRLANANVVKGDVIFTHAGNIGQVAYIPEHSEFTKYVISQRQFYMRCNQSEALPQFVTAYFKSPEGQHKLLANASQVGVPSIAQPVTYLRTIELPLPPLVEQRAITHILDTMEDKIELNQIMNKTLETMARALFKSWFIDFDPVRAKMEGRDPNLPRHIADLFPSRLVDSELGKIPAGWQLSEIGKEVDAVGGATPSTKETAYWKEGQNHWATPKDLSNLSSPVLLETERKITNAGLDRISSGLLPIGTVLLSCRAPIGYLAIAGVPTAVNQGFIAMICEKRLPNLFVLFWCQEKLEYIKGIAGGSTFAEISKRAFRPIPLAVPCEKILCEYEEFVRPFYDQVVANTIESGSLGYLRDILLPKLTSGELSVIDAEFLLQRSPQ